MDTQIDLSHPGDGSVMPSASEMHPAAASAPLSDSDRKELHFWRTDPLENPNGDLFDNVVNKADFMKTFALLAPLIDAKPGQVVAELGAGHCWASAMLKRLAPGTHVIASDVSPDAVAFASRYERLLGVEIDEKRTALAHHLPFDSRSIDTVFAFAAFHHFIIGDRYAEVIGEIFRVLKPGGRAVLLYEPSAPPLLYDLAHRRVNDIRAIDEDVIQLGKLRTAVERLRGEMRVSYFPETRFRPGIKQMLYYAMLARFTALQHLLPCTVNVELRAPRDPGAAVRAGTTP